MAPWPGQGPQLGASVQLGAPGSGTAGITTGQASGWGDGRGLYSVPVAGRAWSWFWSQINTKGTVAAAIWGGFYHPLP